jgi:hypothetical protein
LNELDGVSLIDDQAANSAAKSKGTIFEIVYRRVVSRLGHNQIIGAIRELRTSATASNPWGLQHDGGRFSTL